WSLVAIAGTQLVADRPADGVELGLVHNPMSIGAKFGAGGVVQAARAAQVAQAAAEDLGAEQLAVLAGWFAKNDALAVGRDDRFGAHAKPNRRSAWGGDGAQGGIVEVVVIANLEDHPLAIGADTVVTGAVAGVRHEQIHADHWQAGGVERFQ